MNRLFVFLFVIAWSAAIQAGPKEDALAAYEKFFAYFTTDNHDQLVTVFSPRCIFLWHDRAGTDHRTGRHTAVFCESVVQFAR